MQKIILGCLGFAFILALAIPGGFRAQMQTPSPHLPRGTATDVSNSEIEAMVRKVAAVRVSDQAIRVVSIAGEYNVGVSVVSRIRHRAQPDHRDLSRHLRQRHARDRRHTQ
jgi:hypothetical protein